MASAQPLARCEAVTAETLQSVFTQLHAHRVRLEGLLLHAKLVWAGPSGPQRMRVEPIAKAMVSCFRRVVPAAVAGIVCMPGGARLPLATADVRAMDTLGKHPWALIPSFSLPALSQQMGVLTPEEEQAAWQAVGAWMADPHMQPPPLQAVQTLVLETLAPTTWTHDVDTTSRVASRELRTLLNSAQRDVTRVLGTTLGEWQRHHRISGPQGIPLDTLLAYCSAGGPVHAGGLWPAIEFQGTTVLVRAGQGAHAPQRFRVELRRGRQVIEALDATDGVVRMTLDYLRAAQAQGAEYLVIVGEDLDAARRLIERASDQLGALLVFRFLARRQAQPKAQAHKMHVWASLFARTVEHVLLPRMRRVGWVQSALYRAQREGAERRTDIVQAYVTAMLACDFTHRTMDASISFFTYTETEYGITSPFGRKLLAMLGLPLGVPSIEVVTSPTDHPIEGVQPDIVQPALEVQDAEVRRQQAAATWDHIQHVFAPGATALRAWLLSYFHDERLLTQKEIAQAISQPSILGLTDMCGLLDESDWPPGVTQEEAYQALQGLTYDSIRQWFVRDGARLLGIRPPAQPKPLLWRWMRQTLESQDGVTQEAIRFWLLWELQERSGFTWETISEIVRQIHKVSTQAHSEVTQASGKTCPPPDPRLDDKHRPPRVSWEAVGHAWAHVPTHKLTAEALQRRFNAVLRYLQAKGREEHHAGGEEHDEGCGS